ncbi:hypothetical protein BDR06DRAFT_949027 [Suillus hirtellus]|nr:hypothetical protein BDR06DRAFT_949027 [Suillus hirtellus]
MNCSLSKSPSKAACALYKFEGKAGFRELVVEAGDELNILKEAGDGWSLVRVSSGEIGLLPQTYYTPTFTYSPKLLACIVPQTFAFLALD